MDTFKRACTRTATLLVTALFMYAAAAPPAISSPPAKSDAALGIAGALNRGNSLARRLLVQRGALTELKALVAARGDRIVQTSLGQLRVKAGAVVYIHENAEGTTVAIYCLADGHKNSVQVECDSDIIRLEPGRQLVLSTRKAASFDALNPASTIGYRWIKEGATASSVKAFLSDFSIVSALTASNEFRSALASFGGDRKALEADLVKMAAIQYQMTAARGPFRTSQPAGEQSGAPVASHDATRQVALAVD